MSSEFSMIIRHTDGSLSVQTVPDRALFAWPTVAEGLVIYAGPRAELDPATSAEVYWEPYRLGSLVRDTTQTPMTTVWDSPAALTERLHRLEHEETLYDENGDQTGYAWVLRYCLDVDVDETCTTLLEGRYPVVETRKEYDDPPGGLGPRSRTNTHWVYSKTSSDKADALSWSSTRRYGPVDSYTTGRTRREMAFQRVIAGFASAASNASEAAAAEQILAALSNATKRFVEGANPTDIFSTLTAVGASVYIPLVALELAYWIPNEILAVLLGGEA